MDKQLFQALINLETKINTLRMKLAKELKFQVRHMNIIAQKVDSTNFKTFAMIIAMLEMKNKEKISDFFKKICLFVYLI